MTGLTVSARVKWKTEMLLDVTVVPRSSYFSQPLRDSSLLLVKAEILVIQMFVYTCSKRREAGGEASTTPRWGRVSAVCCHGT